MIQAATLKDVVRYGVSYKSVAAMAANTPETVFAPASNVDGAVIWDARFVTWNASASHQSGFLAKTSAPLGITDGDVIVSPDTSSGSAANSTVLGKLLRPILIPAGKGLYYLTTVLEAAGAYRMVLYTLL